MDSGDKPFRVLSIDGGGMRGLYTAAYLSSLVQRYSVTRGEAGLDIGKGFDLITGTSTGAIIACGLAAGVSRGGLQRASGGGPAHHSHGVGVSVPEGDLGPLWGAGH